MTLNKTKLALGIAASAFSLALVAPQAFAGANTAQRTTDEAAQKAQALEAQLEKMSGMMQNMQAELNRVKAASEKANSETAKVQELDQWMSSVKSAPEAASSKDNLVAIRTGFEQLDSARGNGDPTQSGGFLSDNKTGNGFYFGGAFDYNINNDLFGLWNDTSFQVELGVEYSQFGKAFNTLTGGGILNPNTIVTTNQKATDARLRINASPKIKFFHGSKFRPWLIPVGFEINVLGVPSNAVSVLNSGMQFGAGAEYDLWRGIVVGADTRYHYATGTLDGTPTNGVSVGGYLGFKF